MAGNEAIKELLEMGREMVLTAALSSSSGLGPMIQVWRQKAESWHHNADDRVGIAGAHAIGYRDYADFFEGYLLGQEPQPAFFAGWPASAACVQLDDRDIQGHQTRLCLKSHLLRWQGAWLTFNRVGLLASWTRET